MKVLRVFFCRTGDFHLWENLPYARHGERVL